MRSVSAAIASEVVPACVLLFDTQIGKLTVAENWTVLRRVEDVRMGRVARLFVVVPSTRLAAVAPVVKEAQRLHKLAGLIVRNDVVSPDWLISEFFLANLRSVKNALVHSDQRLPQRVVSAWGFGVEDEMIAAATADDETLYVRDCALQRYVIKRSAVPVLARLSAEEFREFTVAPNGEYLHWSAGDLHVSLLHLKAVLDPREAVRQKIEQVSYSQQLGSGIRAVREAHRLLQSKVAGLSARELRRIEAGERTPHVTTLEKLAAAHGLDLASYLNEIAAAV